MRQPHQGTGRRPNIGALACPAATLIGALDLHHMPPADRYAKRPRKLDWPAYQRVHETHA